ncbi:MAG: ELM1/GtrOC1 family putative glycosyltransferase [Micavibrio sp.]|nr:ELM1/GtrOC1 family putative glycosyltransferase [Micavibrio sp.]
MAVQQDFNVNAAPPYNNGAKPLVLVDIAHDEPGRGDTHGYIGIARRVAQETNAEFMYVDNHVLEDMYPQLRDREERLLQLFEDKGCPDFLFSRWLGFRVHQALEEKGTGVVISNINEQLADSLGMPHRKYPQEIVPHHLSPEELQYQGQRFAEEYQELPRPFIGVNLVSMNEGGTASLAERLAALKNAYPEATFFICSCHRTDERAQRHFMKMLREGLQGSEDKFPVVEFDYKAQMAQQGQHNFWNPYVGLIDQADHLIVAGTSMSMISEPLVAGRTVHTTEEHVYKASVEKGYLRPLSGYPLGIALRTHNITPVDMTGECAERIIQRHAKMKEQTRPPGLLSRMAVKLKLQGAPPVPQRYMSV